MIIKQLPEDFVVEELNDFKIKDSGAYKLYTLEKHGMESFYLFSHLAKENGFSVIDIGYAGLKDKHAVTRQYLTLPADKEFKNLREKNFELKFLGYVDERIKSGQMAGNKFVITVRKLGKGEFEAVARRAAELQRTGVPNYFDEQRFGSVGENEFPAKYVARGNYEKAVRAYLTSKKTSDRSRLRRERELIKKNWGNFEGLDIESTDLLGILTEYISTKDWLKAYLKIPTNIRKMSLSAYQSYLWNECARAVLLEHLPKNKLYDIDYPEGKFTFYRDLSEKELSSLPQHFKTLGPVMELDSDEERVVKKVLSKEGLKLKGLDIKDATGDYFGVRERLLILRPKDFAISEPEPDEINPKSFKVKLAFSLPPGSYATMITRRIFNS